MTFEDITLAEIADGFERMYARCVVEVDCAGCGKPIRGAHRRRWCPACHAVRQTERAKARSAA